jgi:hypothetical protein
VVFTIYRQSKVIVDGEEVDASCDSPDHTRRSITIRTGLTPQRELDVLIHEMLHGAYWDLSEEAIAETATDIAAVLFAMGYRKRHSPPKSPCPSKKKTSSSGKRSTKKPPS